MKGSRFLTELVDCSTFQKGKLNLIEAPTGCGKTYFALKHIPSLVKNPLYKVAFLIDTTNGKEQAARIDMQKAATKVEPLDPKGDTIWLGVVDKDGNAVSWASSGTSGFKGSKKKTPFAAGMSAEAAGKAAYDSGMRKVDVFVRGLGSGRETAIRSLQTAGLEILSITDVTPVPHNGCRPPKRPRG